MSVYQRRKKSRTGKETLVWIVDVKFKHPDGRIERAKPRSPVQTRRGAEQYERQLRQAMLEGKRGRKEVSFKDFATEFKDVYVKGKLTWATQLAYGSSIKIHLLPAFEKYAMRDLCSDALMDRFAAKLRAKGLGRSTERNILGVLSKMLHKAKDWGYIDTIPKISLPKVPTPDFRFLSDEEITALMAAAGDYWGPAIFFGLMTGCRQGEIWALEREQLDLEHRVVRIDRAVYRGKVGLPKHGKVRKIEMSPGLVEFMREHLKVVPLKSSLVFPTEQGTIRQERKAAVGLNRACERAGLKPFGWHVLRHTFASHLVMGNVQLQAVQQLLGHASIKETERYAHLSPHMKRDAVAKLDELTFASQGRPRGAHQVAS